MDTLLLPWISLWIGFGLMWSSHRCLSKKLAIRVAAIWQPLPQITYAISSRQHICSILAPLSTYVLTWHYHYGIRVPMAIWSTAIQLSHRFLPQIFSRFILDSQWQDFIKLNNLGGFWVPFLHLVRTDLIIPKPSLKDSLHYFCWWWFHIWKLDPLLKFPQSFSE